MSEDIYCADAGVQFGVPVLECDGEVLQSNGVIAKFLAAKFSKVVMSLYLGCQLCLFRHGWNY